MPGDLLMHPPEPRSCPGTPPDLSPAPLRASSMTQIGHTGVSGGAHRVSRTLTQVSKSDQRLTPLRRIAQAGRPDLPQGPLARLPVVPTRCRAACALIRLHLSVVCISVDAAPQGSARMNEYKSGARRCLERTLPGVAAQDPRSYDLPDFRTLGDG